MSYVILGISGHDYPVPMTTDGADFALFSSHQKAKAAAEAHPFFSKRGYKIVSWPYCGPNQ